MEDEDYPGHDEEILRACRDCGNTLDGKRTDALYCSDACRKRYTRHEKRLEARRNSYLSRNSLNYADLSIDELHELMQEAPARPNTRELVDEAEDDTGLDEIRAELERTWSEFEHRNPGVAHPDRVRARIDHERALKAAEEVRFTRKPKTIAELGWASRRLSPQSRATTDLFQWE